MLAYAPERRTAGAGRSSARTLALVVAGHVGFVAVALTTKFTIDRIAPPEPIDVVTVRNPPPVEPVEPEKRVEKPAPTSTVDRPQPQLPLKPIDDGPIVDPGPPASGGPVIGNEPGGGIDVIADTPTAEPVRIAARFNTPSSMLRPPYPLSKIRSEEEATLKLRLTIDERGRVVGVEPVGKADADFLEAARRHILKNWRYKPATVDGIAAGSSTVISLSFKLEEA